MRLPVRSLARDQSSMHSTRASSTNLGLPMTGGTKFSGAAVELEINAALVLT